MTFLRRCELSSAAVQLRAIPECASLDSLVPRGLPLRAPCAPPPLPARAAARAAADRLQSITRNLPGGDTSALTRAALRRGAAAAEACLDASWGLATLGALRGAEAARLRAPAPGAPTREDFDTAGGAARAFSAEVALAWARLALAGGGGGGEEAVRVLRASLAASSAIEEELRFVGGPGDARAAAALLPAALAHARANALRVLLCAFGAEDGAEGGAPTPAALLALVGNACDSADDVAARALGGGAGGAGAYVPLRTALIRAAARQNAAAAHLRAAAAALTAPPGGGGGAPPAARAQGELTLAHAQLSDALALARGAAEGAAARAGAPGGAGASAWEGLAGDAALSAASLSSSVAEAELLLALSVLWCGAAGAAPARLLLPLTGSDRSLVAPVLARAWEGASASLRAFEALEGTGGGGGGSAQSALPPPPPRARSSDAGFDAALGAARPLRLLGLLNGFEGRSVTAEGAFRAVLDRHSAVAPFFAPLPPPPAAAAAAGAARLCFAALLRQTEKRSGEAAACEAEGRTDIVRAAAAWCGAAYAPLALPPAGATGGGDFLAAAAACAAVGAAHVGGWGLALHADLAELELR
jgi:hypothetical protein